MAHLVTGHKGEAHVSSMDASCLNSGVWGKGGSTLQTRNNLQCTLIENDSKVQVDTGDCIICGRQCCVEEPETLNVSGGVTGKKRIDYVVCRVELTENYELCELVIKKGEESLNNPTAPTLTQEDLTSGGSTYEYPLARLDFDGLNVNCTQISNPIRDFKSEIQGHLLGELVLVMRYSWSLYVPEGGVSYIHWTSKIPSGYTAIAQAGWHLDSTVCRIAVNMPQTMAIVRDPGTPSGVIQLQVWQICIKNSACEIR